MSPWWRCRSVLYLAGACGGTVRLLLCQRHCLIASTGDFDIALYPLLTEAWAGHDRDFVHAFAFLAVAVDGAELLSRGLLIGPTSTSGARTAGNDGRMVVDFNIITRWQQRNAVDLPHHGGAFVSFLHFFYFFAPRWPFGGWISAERRAGRDFLINFLPDTFLNFLRSFRIPLISYYYGHSVEFLMLCFSVLFTWVFCSRTRIEPISWSSRTILRSSRARVRWLSQWGTARSCTCLPLALRVWRDECRDWRVLTRVRWLLLPFF